MTKQSLLALKSSYRKPSMHRSCHTYCKFTWATCRTYQVKSIKAMLQLHLTILEGQLHGRNLHLVLRWKNSPVPAQNYEKNNFSPLHPPPPYSTFISSSWRKLKISLDNLGLLYLHPKKHQNTTSFKIAGCPHLTQPVTCELTVKFLRKLFYVLAPLCQQGDKKQ